MTGDFYIVGPTASGKSEIAADLARKINAEIINVDAFQVYAGLDLLSAKPDPAILSMTRHHLVGAVPLNENMNAGEFRRMALPVIDDIHSRGKAVLVVGGSGLYVKALTHGLDSDWKAADVDPKGVFVFRDREELYRRINSRVERMFKCGVVEEVRGIGELSSTAEKMIGLREIRELIAGKMSMMECVAAIQQATRRYAKRQLTWFRRQTNFEPLNLSLLTHNEAVIRISRTPKAFGVAPGND